MQMTLGLCFALPGLLLTGFSASASSVRGSHGGQSNVSADEAASKLWDVLSAVINSSEPTVSRRAQVIKGRAVHAFDALPKNGFGRLAPKAVRYLVQNYFAMEHGWLINGLEPHGNKDNVSDVHEAQILEDKVPTLVESLLEAKRNNRGLALEDVVALAITLEQLIFNESQVYLHDAYAVNGLAETETLEESQVHDVLTSFLFIAKFGDAEKQFQWDPEAHSRKKSRLPHAAWEMIVNFEQQVLEDFKRAERQGITHSGKETYTFREVSSIVGLLVEGYGKWQQIDCGWMKQDLIALDPDGTGRVPLGSFYSHPPNAHFTFRESAAYLREIGALEDTDGMKVRIANYVAGPSNCVAESKYFSVCCLTGCEHLMSHLEAEVRAPTASPEKLLALVSNMSSSTVQAPRQLADGLVARLHSIAQHHGGVVPLHGRLFSQWLHHAFPYECPFPEIVEDNSVWMPRSWEHQLASPDEQAKHIELAASAWKEHGGAADTCVADLPWVETEFLHTFEETAAGEPQYMSGRDALQVAVQLALLGSIAVATLQTAVSGISVLQSGRKREHQLPF